MTMYRLKFKSEAFTIEMEGPDQSIIEEKLNKLINLSNQIVSNKVATKSLQSASSYLNSIEDFDEEEIEVIDGRVDPDRIADIIRNSKRIQAIQNKILNKSNQLFRILLILHYATAIYGNRGYSTGLMEEVTASLGKRLRKSNIAAQIKLNGSYFVSDRDPGKGVTALYLLTDEGRESLEAKLNS